MIIIRRIIIVTPKVLLGGISRITKEAMYFVDTTRVTQWESAPFYERAIQDLLGQQEDPPDNTDLDTNTGRHCFNCGSPSHTLSDLPPGTTP
jgi:hypothetical protein